MASDTRTAIQRYVFVSLVQPHPDGLSERFGAMVLATQVTAVGQMVVIALSQVLQRFNLPVDLGCCFPLLISATGRCLADEAKDLDVFWDRLGQFTWITRPGLMHGSASRPRWESATLPWKRRPACLALPSSPYRFVEDHGPKCGQKILDIAQA